MTISFRPGTEFYFPDYFIKEPLDDGRNRRNINHIKNSLIHFEFPRGNEMNCSKAAIVTQRVEIKSISE
jgi:hypothetical protein